MDKKTLGIITFNRASNYGAVLQAYALKRVCEDMGFEVHVVDYINGTKGNPAPLRVFLESKNKKRAFVRFCRSCMSFFWNKKRWNEFVSFRNEYLNESKTCYNKEEIEALGYDYYVIGSDQIWNFNITGGAFDPVYFGSFGSKERCVIYAASSQDIPFPLDKELEFRQRLLNTSADISVREEKLSNYVGELTGAKYPTVLDPTLLAGREIMEAISDAAVSDKPYILVYQIDTNPASDISVRSLETRFHHKVYTMTVPRIGSLNGRKGTAGPKRFLSLVKNAEFLVTNSFHGVALSLLFEKQFFVYENNGVMNRIDGLLDSLQLNNRKVKMVADIDLTNTIEYSSVKERLDELRKESYVYLYNALIRGENANYGIYKPKENTLKPLAERKKEDCSGCTTCKEACPVNAISMTEDEEGFKYPIVDSDACIHCGLCDTICGFVPKKKEPLLPRAFGVKHKSLETRLTSRSGGAFVAFSDLILRNGGVVYGAAIQSDFSVKHTRATNSVERDLMKTAKYVQSDVDGIFPQVIDDLNNNKMVLFTGTPCQVMGLYAYLNVSTVKLERLYTCDLVCHGVPSPKIWSDYVRFIESRYHGKVQNVSFRDKTFGWDSHYESFILDSGRKIVSRDFTDMFYEHIMFRPSCYKCRFSNVNRVADITLADFWGIEKNKPEFDDNKGVSLVLINTDKGEELFNISSCELDYFECDIKNCIQPTMVKPSVSSPRRDEFWDDYKKLEFSVFLKKYTTPLSLVRKGKKRVKQMLYKTGLRDRP